MKYEDYSYRYAEEIINGKIDLKNEILDVVRIVRPSPLLSGEKGKFEYGQKRLNDAFVEGFVQRGWTRQPKVVNTLNLKADFKKDGVQVEVQFGNAARYYADLMKFQLAFDNRNIDMGVEIIAKNLFGKKMDSNMTNYERCIKEIEKMRTTIAVPIWVIGIEP